jgi:multiple sugar transport system permease protein
MNTLHVQDRNCAEEMKCRKIKLSEIITFAVLVLVSVVLILPVVIMITTALKSDSELLAYPPALIPAKPMFSNFAVVFTKVKLFTYIKNSLFVSGLTVVGTVFSSAFVAFGFSRYRAPGKNVLFMLLIATLMIPYPVTMVPQFVLFQKLGWVDKYLPLIAPAFFGSAYMIFLLKQFFSSLTDELFEAARIDGCSEFRSFISIAFPLCMPALATVAIFSFLWSWDDLLGPVIYLNSMDKYTLPVALAGLKSQYKVVPWNTLMASACIAVVPAVALFFFCQRYFVEGIVLTGLK